MYVEDMIPVRAVPLDNAPWFQKRNLTFKELGYLQRQFYLAKKTVVHWKSQIGPETFLHQGNYQHSPLLPPNHPFYLAQWSSNLLEEVIIIGLEKNAPKSLIVIAAKIVPLFNQSQELYALLGLRTDKIVDELFSVRQFVPSHILNQ